MEFLLCRYDVNVNIDVYWENAQMERDEVAVSTVDYNYGIGLCFHLA